VDVQVDLARRHQLAVQVNHLTRLRRQANADRGDPVPFTASSPRRS
jgi:hypothetical protein